MRPALVQEDPGKRIPALLKWTHDSNGHLGAD